LKSIEVAKKNLYASTITAEKKKVNSKLVNKNLKIEIGKMNEIIKIQKQGKEEIDRQIAEMQKELNVKDKGYKDKSISLEKTFETEKSENEKKFAIYKEKLESKVKKENTYIKTILGVYILQKYFFILTSQGIL